MTAVVLIGFGIGALLCGADVFSRFVKLQRLEDQLNVFQSLPRPHYRKLPSSKENP